MAYGLKSHVNFNYQNCFGTVTTNSFETLTIISESVQDKRSQIQTANGRARFYQTKVFGGTSMTEGSVSTAIHPVQSGFWFQSFFGQASQTFVNSHVAHEFTVKDFDLFSRCVGSPYTLEVYRDQGSAFIYNDLNTTGLNIGIANNELLTLNVDVIGAGAGRESSNTPTFANEAPFKWDQTSISFNGAAGLCFQNLNIEFKKQIQSLHTLTTSRSPHYIKRTGEERGTINGTVLFESHSLYNAFVEENEGQLVCSFTDNNSNSLKFDFPSVRFTDVQQNINVKGVLKTTFNALIEYNENSQSALAVTLTNTQDIYLAAGAFTLDDSYYGLLDQDYNLLI